MKKLIIIITGLISICFAAIVVGVLFLANLDLNNYKDWLSEQFYDRTGRELTITGNIESSIYPWLGLEVEGLSISNPSGFSAGDFLIADKASFRIKLMPLLNQEYEIDTLELIGATLNLAVDADEGNNWSSMNDSAEDPVQSEGIVFNQLIIGGVVIDAVQVNYVNQANGQTINADDITMNIPQLVYGEPLELAMNFHLSASNPGIADIESDISLSSTVTYDLENNIYAVENLGLDFLDSKLEADLSSNNGTISGSINFYTERTLELLSLFGQNELAEKLQGIEDIDSGISLSSSLTYDLDNNIYSLEAFNLNFFGSTLEADIRSNDGIVSGPINFSSESTQELFVLLDQNEMAERIAEMESDIRISSSVSYDIENNSYRLENLDLEFLDSTLEADLRNNDGSINGSINFSSENTGELLHLFGQAELAERIDDIQLLVYLDGNTENLLLLPFDLNFSLSGDPLILPTNVHLYTNAELDLNDENLMLNDFSISALDLLLEGKFNIANLMNQPEINGEFDIESFNPKALSSSLLLELPQTRDPNVLEQIAFSTSLSASSESAELNRFIFEFDDTLITGSLSANNFNQAEIRFDVDINTLNVDRYLAPEQSPTQANNNTDNVDTSLSSLQSLNLDGELNIDELMVSGLRLNNVLLGLTAEQGLIELAPAQANLYQGSYNGSVNLNVNNEEPEFTMQSTLQNINIEPLSNDFIGASYASGNGTINLALAGRGSNTQDILNSLNGTADLTLNEGILQGVDVGAVLSQLETMIRSRRILAVERGEQTAFDNLSATIQVEDGIARSSDLLVQAPGFNVTGIGTLANLQNQTINFDLLVSVNTASATLESEEYDIGGYSLPINCSGSMNSPRCVPDADSILSAAIGNVIQEGIGNVLQEGVGGLLDSVLGTGREPQTDETTTEEESNAEQTEPAEELLNNVLDSLFR